MLLSQKGTDQPGALLITGGSSISSEPHLDRPHCFQMKRQTKASHGQNLMHVPTFKARDSHSISLLRLLRDLINL